jgi:hypothetical protein
MRAFGFLAWPELFGVRLQEVVEAFLLRFGDGPVVGCVHVMLKEVVQDETFEEALAARVLIACWEASEREFGVGGVEADVRDCLFLEF